MIVKLSKYCVEVAEGVRQPSEQDMRGCRIWQGLANSTVLLFSAGGLSGCGQEEWTGLVPRT